MSSKKLNVFAIVALVATSFYFPSYENKAAAQSVTPNISSVTGSISERGTLIINGSGFGVKPQAAPLKWDNFDSGTLDQRVSNGWYTERRSGNYPLYSNEHQRSGSSLAVKQDYVTLGQYNNNFGLHNPNGSTKYYVSFYRYAVLPDSPDKSRNYKIMSLRGGNAGDWGISTNHAEFRHDIYPLNNSGHTYVGDVDGHTNGNNWSNAFALSQNTWERFEYIMDAGDLGISNGYFQYYLNGYLRNGSNNLLVRNREASTPIWTNIYFNGYYARETISNGTILACSGNQCPANFWVDDVYIDTTPARVELCTGATWSDRGQCEIQIPTAWNSNAVTISANPGALANGQTAYLYVIDSNNVASNAYQVVVAGINTPPVVPPTDNQAPSVPTDLIANATSTQVNLSWAASTDNVGVAGYQILRSISNGSGYTQIATSTTNSYVNTGLTAGTTYYYVVRAYDAAGNVSANSMTVSATVPSVLISPPNNNNNSSPWCSALLGIVSSAVNDGAYNRVADINRDSTVNLTDLTLIQQYHSNNNDSSCQARFLNTYTNDNYLNINWCAGIIQGLSDHYNVSTASNNYSSIFDLNNDGVINLTDTVLASQYSSANNQATCFAEYALPLNTTSASKQVISKLPSISTLNTDNNLQKRVNATKTEVAKLRLLKGHFAQLSDGSYVYVNYKGQAVAIDDENITQVLAKQALGISKANLVKLQISLNYNGVDSDGDLVPDEIEKIIGTDPNNKDTDGDGYTDGVEMENYYSPLKNTPKARLDKNLAKRLSGRILIVVPGGSLFYVNPSTYKLELLKDLSLDNLINLGLIKEVKGIKIRQ